MTIYIGVDVSCETLEVWDPRRQAARTFGNTGAGVLALIQWLGRERAPQELQLILEPTSMYHHLLVQQLQQRAIARTVINPARTASYSREEGRRAKTDKADARLLAQMGQEKQLPADPPLDPDQEELKTLRRQREWLQEEIQRARNRLETLQRSPWTTKAVSKSLERTIRELRKEVDKIDGSIREYLRDHKALDQQVRSLDKVRGIGWLTAVTLVSELPPVAYCPDAKAWVAYCGLNPAIVQSGRVSISQLSRLGPERIGKALYWPTISALRCNPSIQAMGKRLRGRGKLEKQVIVAAMTKLVRQCFGVLKSGKPFDPSWQFYRQPLASPIDIKHGI